MAAVPRTSPGGIVLLSALLFFLAHSASLPPAFDDLDAINFAMGVRDFDVARHQPHPPGYPVFIALGKLSTAAFRAVGAAAPDVAGLAVWSAIGGAVLLVMVFLFSRSVWQDDAQALMAMVLTGAAPLVWFNALRPLSDTAGLGMAFAALAALARGSDLDFRTGKRDAVDPVGFENRDLTLLAGAFLAGLSGGFRVQMLILTAPLLAWIVLNPRRPMRGAVRAGVLACAAAGVLAWAIPLVAVSGGFDAYLQALGSQAGEDFAGVVMLWTHRTPRAAIEALLNTFMLPWASPVLAGIVLGLAVCGFGFCIFHKRRSVITLAVVFGPYLVFHLLFQETVTTRYALPLIPALAMLVAVALAQARRIPAMVVFAATAAACLVHAAPAGLAFGGAPSPIFAALSEMEVLAARGAPPIVGMHRRIWSESRRARQWHGAVPGKLLDTPRDYEWLQLTRAWREGYDGEGWFLADPRRTDLALIDAEHRRSREYRWPFDGRVYEGGARPGELDWHIYTRPGWFLERGWALTPEIAGITERDGWGPHRRPSLGWIRRRPGDALMVFGGRHLGNPGDSPARIRIAIDGRELAALAVRPGAFLEFLPVPAGTLQGDGQYAELTVVAEATAPGPVPRVAIEQFNLQSPDVVQFGFGDGWFEPEYNPQTARSWRWMSDDAVLRVHNAGRDVSIAIAGESPLRYYDTAPVLRVVAGETVLRELRPDRDFEVEVKVPAGALERAGGAVHLRSSASFVAGDRDGSADRRQLALRIYRIRISG